MIPTYCNQCGQANAPEARFCAMCGKPVAAGGVAPQAAGARAPAVRVPVIVGGVLAVLIVLAGLFLAFLVFKPGSPASPIDVGASAVVETAREQSKAQLLASPSQFLEIQGSKFHDKGIINHYGQLVLLTILNRSSLPVQSIAGEVDWIDEAGNTVGSIPFSVRGSIVAGDTKTFSTQEGTLTNATLQTDAKRAKIRITHVEIIE